MSSLSKQTTKSSGLKLGQFKAHLKLEGNSIQSCLVDTLTQEELADDWRIVLPGAGKKSSIHHFSVYLSQLPPYLWNLIKTKKDENNEEYYVTIIDNIYHYSIKKSKSDMDVHNLYTEIMRTIPDLAKVSLLVNELEQQRVKGWIMIRAKKMLDE